MPSQLEVDAVLTAAVADCGAALTISTSTMGILQYCLIQSNKVLYGWARLSTLTDRSESAVSVDVDSPSIQGLT